jgi:hypothetical protein
MTLEHVVAISIVTAAIVLAVQDLVAMVEEEWRRWRGRGR